MFGSKTRAEKWFDTCVDREYKANSKKYCKDGSLYFGASVAVMKRLEKGIPRTKNTKKQKFLSEAYRYGLKLFD